MKLLNKMECKQLVGFAITPALLLAYLMLVAGIAGIVKVLFSASGRVSITGMTFQWRK